MLVGDDLVAVEEEIRRQLDSPVALIREMGGYIAGAGGKRLRPMLLLLSARLAGYRGPRSIRLACVVELLHTATLIHDDVVDQAPLRRGRPSANAQWGDDASVLVGDHLYSKSFALLVRDNDRAVMETLARSTVSMTEAEVFQLERKRSGVTTETDYLKIITQKTASFISACCRIGALVGDVAPAKVVRLPWPGPRSTPRSVHGTVVHVDRFGNLITCIDGESTTRLGRPLSVRIGRHRLPLVETYGDLPPRSAGALVGSRNRVEVVVREGSAAATLGAGRGTAVELTRRCHGSRQ